MKPFSTTIERIHKVLGFINFLRPVSLPLFDRKQGIIIVEPFLLGDAIIACKFATALLNSDRLSSVHVLVDSKFCSTLKVLFPGIHFIGHDFEFLRRFQLHKYLFNAFILRKILIKNGISIVNDFFVDIRGDFRIAFFLFAAHFKKRLGFKSAGNGIFCNFVIDNTATERNLYAETALLTKVFDCQSESVHDIELVAHEYDIYRPRHVIVHFGASQPKRIPPLDFAVEFIAQFGYSYAGSYKNLYIDVCRFPEFRNFADCLVQLLEKKGFSAKVVEFESFHDLVVESTAYDAVLCVDSALLHAIDISHKSVHVVFGPSTPDSIINPAANNVKSYFKKAVCCPCDGSSCVNKDEKLCYWGVLNEF